MHELTLIHAAFLLAPLTVFLLAWVVQRLPEKLPSPSGRGAGGEGLSGRKRAVGEDFAPTALTPTLSRMERGTCSRPFPWYKRLALPTALLVGGAAGARLPVVLASADWVADGRTLTTGLAVGYLMVEAMRVACQMPPAAHDGLALPLALALVAARLECFAAGCCRGLETSVFWAVDFGDGVPRHPTQFYEAAFHLTAALAILAGRRSEVVRGEVLRLYLLAYCLFRFATEWIRLEPACWLGLTLSQIIVATMGAVLAILGWHDFTRNRRTVPHKI